jgi:hypothetical protein
MFISINLSEMAILQQESVKLYLKRTISKIFMCYVQYFVDHWLSLLPLAIVLSVILCSVL